MDDLLSPLVSGFPALIDVAAFVARVVVGLMFFLSGFYKLFSAKQVEKMTQTMEDAGISAPRATGRLVSVCEFVFGAALVMGVFSIVAALVLAIISLVALLTVARKSVEGTSFGFRLSSFLDLPETLLLVILAWLIVNGPGLYSLDRALFGAAVSPAS